MAEANYAGLIDNCPDCNASISVPARQALVPMVRRAKPLEVTPADDDGEMEFLEDTGSRGGDKPVELRLGNMIGMKADVDKPTRNSMALVTTGGILVALGSLIAAMFFGGKSKSS